MISCIHIVEKGLCPQSLRHSHNRIALDVKIIPLLYEFCFMEIYAYIPFFISSSSEGSLPTVL
jgi:hypothetical protein